MMRKKLYVYLILLLFLLPLLSFSGQKAKSSKDLSATYRKWLEEEVVYIITPKEKEVFLQLETDRERNLFMEAFWKHRDPNPTTPENEFKDEHYRRIKYANQNFGREGPGAGWKSAMGRIYILLGQPGYIERYENYAEVYPTVIWSYSARPELGLLQAFNVVFFKRGGLGEYELYSPVRFGPHQLLVHFKGDPADYMSAYQELFEVEPTLAYSSMTLLQGERTYVTSPSIASEVLINATIPSVPQRQVEDAWAEKLLAYKDIVEVEYSANYIDNDSYIRVIEDQSGIHFVHYLIEPSRLTFEQYGGRFLSNLEVNANVTDLDGATVYQYERTIPIEFDQDQMDNIRNKLFSFQDMFPLVEGNYKLNILLKNQVSKEFTSVEADLSIPESSNELRMTPLILANKALSDSKYKGKSKPFLLGDIQLVPSPRNDFSQQDHLYLYLQIQGLTEELKETGSLEFTISTGDNIVRSIRKEIKEYPDAPNLFEDIPLSGLPTGYYEIKAALFEKDRQQETLYEETDFYISYAASLPRPWLLSLPVSSPEDPIYQNILGNQYMNKKDHFKAKPLLEAAFHRNPESVKFALDFCINLYNLKEYQKVKEIAQPFLDRPERHQFYAILGQSCQALSELAEAISYYKSYLTYFGTHIQILNSVGDCYLQLGNKEEALTAWTRSLELDPKQDKLREKVESLKDKD
jgi:GWxTD domain-containing protein